MIKAVEQAFNAVYKKIAKSENHINLLIDSNWGGVDVFQTADYKATIIASISIKFIDLD